jgi:hypothetical protein
MTPTVILKDFITRARPKPQNEEYSNVIINVVVTT